MTTNKRQEAIFASGILLGGVAAALVGAGILSDAPLTSASSNTAKSASAPQASGQVLTCPLEPAAAAAGKKDGQFPFQANLSGLAATEIGSFLVIGKDAAAAGRQRDAEVAFLMSCRIADKLKGAHSVESADAKVQLGGHYAQLALDGGFADQTSRLELRKRAEFLYLDSLATYTSAYGQAHEKSRFAADGLAAVRQQTSVQAGVATAVPVASVVPQAPVAKKLLQPSNVSIRKVEIAKAAWPAAQAQSAAIRPEPGFDCTRTRTASEKMVCSDAELFQRNHELAQVYARAKNATADPASFRRQHDLEWSRRESICRDRGCLLRWYAYRNGQLTNEIEGQDQAQPPSGQHP